MHPYVEITCYVSFCKVKVYKITRLGWRMGVRGEINFLVFRSDKKLKVIKTSTGRRHKMV